MGYDLDPRTDQRSDHFAQHLHVLADVEQFRLECLTACERQQLARQPRRTRDRVRDRIDVAQPARLRQVRPPQQIDRGADHRQQIVEVVRDAAGELPQRLEPLAMLQRFLGLLPLGGLDIEMPRPPQGQSEQEKQQCRRRRAENQMLAHGGEPPRPYRRGLEAGADIDRVFGELLVSEAAFDAVGRRRHGDQAGLGVRRDLLSDRAADDRAEAPGRWSGSGPAPRRRAGRAQRSCRPRGRSGRRNSRNIPEGRTPGSRRRSCRPRFAAGG